jgi:hypothetical protein
MAFAPKAGCPMCSIVAFAATGLQSPPSLDTPPQPDILWRDDNFTAYREKVNPVSSKAHIIIAFKCVFSTYAQLSNPKNFPVYTFPHYTRWYVNSPRSLIRGVKFHLLTIVFE